jgi:hypothetical protein
MKNAKNRTACKSGGRKISSTRAGSP